MKDDAISRKQCIDAVNKILAQYVPKIYLYTLPLELEKTITNLPSVSTEKTGHWISFGTQGEIDGQIVQAFTCSECGAISVFRMIDGKIVNGDLCPNCGAKMEEEE